jgi:hypothetical protein
MAYEPVADRPRAELPAAPPEPSPTRNIAKWGVALAFFLALCVTLMLLQLLQLTSRDVSEPALRRAIVATTELDPLLERNYDDLVERAEASASGEMVLLEDYPIVVALTADEVQEQSRDELRETILDRSVAVMYADGTSALRVEGGSAPGRFDVAGAVDQFLDLMRDRTHDIALVATLVFAVLCVGLAVLLASLCRGFGRLAAVGAVTLAASLALLLAGALLQLSVRSANDGEREYLQEELLEIGETLAWIPVRNGLAFTAFGALVLLIGFVGARVIDRQERVTGERA